ncbi:MAG: sulfite exporter TauE/SafE family protein [Actinobacteria bacterium]|nr:sulfite exporter TauE/SafE family protein [Actinomycetota bacterium]
MDWKLSLSGLLIGALVGLTGMGGGSLMTPLLVIAFGFSPTTAIGTDIAHGAVFKTVGAIRHRRLGTVHARLSGWMFLASAPMSLLGVSIATWLEHHYGDGATSVMARVLAGALVLGSLGLFAKSFIRYSERSNAPFLLSKRDRIAAVSIGAVGGLIVGLTSVGTGVFFGLSLLVLFPLRSAKVVGTDIFHAAALLWVAGFGHFIAGNVDFGAVGWLLIGSIPGVLLGSQFTLRMPDRALRVALAVVLGLSGIKLADLPHENLLLGLGGGLGVGALALVIALPRLQKRIAGPVQPSQP